MLNDGSHRDGNEVAEGVVAELAVDVRKKREHGKWREREVRTIGWCGLEHIKRDAPARNGAIVAEDSTRKEKARQSTVVQRFNQCSPMPEYRPLVD